MKPSEVLRAAALRIHNRQNGNCCGALFNVPCELTEFRAADEYLAKFRPQKSERGPWYLDAFLWWPYGERKQRILALLFAAAIAESEGN